MTGHEPRGRKDFPTTNWSNVRDAGTADAGRNAALDDLLRRYWPALWAHLVYKKKVPPDRAEDLVQSFIQVKMLEGNVLQRANPDKGKFRTFLLTALDRFVIDCHRKEPPATSTGEPIFETSLELGPDVFDVARAMNVLIDSVRRLRAECQNKQRPDLWGVFEGRALAPLQGSAPLSYQSLAERLGLSSDKQAANRYLIAEAMFRRHFRAVLVEESGDDVEEEAREFRRIFSAARAELVEQLRIHLWNDVPEVTVSTSGRSPIDPAALARMLELPRQPTERAEVLRHLLTAPVPLDLGAVDEALARKVRAWTEGQSLMLKSFGDLLQHPNPLPEFLELVKEFAKENRTDAESPLPREVATVLYYASIAVALARCARRITRHNHATLRQGFGWGCEQPWVDEATRSLLREGLRALGDAEEQSG
jgi:RNA polymerase sigma-70 factor (ECF subfamily)